MSDYLKFILKFIFAPIVVGLVLFYIKTYICPPSKYGKLNVQCNQDSTKIFLNEEFKGMTTSKKTVIIDSILPGSYILIGEKIGFMLDTTLNVRINSGEITTVQVQLKELQEPPPSPPPCLGDLSVQCNQEDAKVHLNNDFKGVTSQNGMFIIKALPCKTYQLSVQKKGYKPYKNEAIKIKNNKITSVQVILESRITDSIEIKKLAINISREITNPSISIDKKEHYAINNIDTIPLPKGYHLISITYQNELQESFEYSTRVNLSKDKTLFIEKAVFTRK